MWVVALFATIIWVGDTPDTDSSTARVVAYWAAHDGEQIAGSIIGAVALIFFVWFAGSLRAALRTAEGATGRLSAISFGGALLFAAGGIMSLSFNFAVADTVGDVPPTVTQTLFILNDDVWLWAPVGTALLSRPRRSWPSAQASCRSGRHGSPRSSPWLASPRAGSSAWWQASSGSSA